MAVPSYDKLKGEYGRLWRSMQIRPEWASRVERAARRVLEHRLRYEAVSAKVGVPWYVVGVIHQMEAGGSFLSHLHNGDSLRARTWQVPKGRPKKGEPPFTWEASAEDALRYDGLDKVPSWSIERLLYELEGYNGWGYRRFHLGVLSPYLWSGTRHYERGKYVADGRWSSGAVSGQAGAAAILARLFELTPEDELLGLRRETSGVNNPPSDAGERMAKARPRGFWQWVWYLFFGR